MLIAKERLQARFHATSIFVGPAIRFLPSVIRREVIEPHDKIPVALRYVL